MTVSEKTVCLLMLAEAEALMIEAREVSTMISNLRWRTPGEYLSYGCFHHLRREYRRYYRLALCLRASAAALAE